VSLYFRVEVCGGNVSFMKKVVITQMMEAINITKKADLNASSGYPPEAVRGYMSRIQPIKG
jgi:hypothetical protein